MRHGMKVAIASLGAIMLMAIGAVAYASIPGTGGVITSCVQKSSGVVRIIDTAKESCKSTEQTVPWNQAGQPGTPGTNGTNGKDGVSGYSVVSTIETFEPGTLSQSGTATSSCFGKTALGGGGTFINSAGAPISSNGANTELTGSRPIGAGEGWAVSYSGDNFVALGITGFRVYVTCANVS